MQVAIVKYNAGNICSVDYTLKRLGITPLITDDKEALLSADKVIFPGVGEATTTMKCLRHTGLDQLLPQLKQPVLGICLGMQLMCRFSEEGNVNCLNVFDADVMRFIPRQHEEKVPHMGWNTMEDLKGNLLVGCSPSDFVYFVHSFYVPINEHTIAKTRHIVKFSAAMQKNNFFATQFHPEKSGSIGSLILQNFLAL